MTLAEYNDTPQTSAIQNYDEDQVQQNQSIYNGLSWITFPQAGKKNSHYTKKNLIPASFYEGVTPNARQRAKTHAEDVITVTLREAGTTIEEFVFAQLRFIPLTTYTHWKNQRGTDGKVRSTLLGGRGMWAADPKTNKQINGDGSYIACMSHDGFAPNVTFVGANPPQRNEPNMPWHTGLQKHVAPGPRCETCFFNDWGKYGGSKPQCGQQHKFLVWLPAQQDLNGNVMSERIAIIGGSFSQQRALGGAKAGDKNGHLTLPLLSFDKLMKPTRKQATVVALNDFVGDPRTIIGFASNNDRMRHHNGDGYIDIAEDSLTTDVEVQNAIDLAVSDGKLTEVTHIVYQEQKFEFAPEGLAGAIYPFEFLTVINANKEYPQRIPLMTVKGDDGAFVFDALSPRQKERFLEARVQAAMLRDQWEQQMYENAALVDQKLATPQITISDGPAPDGEIPSDD